MEVKVTIDAVKTKEGCVAANEFMMKNFGELMKKAYGSMLVPAFGAQQEDFD